MATTNSDHPRLTGIVNTNDDPNACAVCALPLLHRTTHALCCGKEICDSCSEGLKGNRCDLCDSIFSKEKKLMVQLKKKARKGHAWAQMQLGLSHHNGIGVPKSTEEALHWFKLASDQDHPHALYHLAAKAVASTKGGVVGLSTAHRLLERAMTSSLTIVGSDLHERCQYGLIDLARKYMALETEEANRKAKSLLLPLVEECSKGSAQGLLGQAFYREGDVPAALKWFSLAAATDSDMDSQLICPEFGALRCCVELGKIAQGKFWGRFSKKILSVPDLDGEIRLIRVQMLVQLQRRLRSLRDTCGGCGVEFEGKERKFCRGCRAYCYCSRECQKMHWDREEDGHREDCKGAMELKQKMKEKKMKEAREIKSIL